MPDTAGSPGHQFRLTAREVGLCDESSHAGNKRDPKAAESTALGGRRVCVSARVPSRPWRPATAPGLAPFNRAAKKLGFVHTGTVPNYYDDDASGWRMGIGLGDKRHPSSPRRM